MPQPVGTFNEIICAINDIAYKIMVYHEDWASLPAGVKTAIKAQTVAKIQEQTTALQDLIDTINGL